MIDHLDDAVRLAHVGDGDVGDVAFLVLHSFPPLTVVSVAVPLPARIIARSFVLS